MKVIIAIAIFLFIFGGGCGTCGSCGSSSGSSSCVACSGSKGCLGNEGCIGGCINACNGCGGSNSPTGDSCEACDPYYKEQKKYAKFFKKHGMTIYVTNYDETQTSHNILFKEFDDAVYFSPAPYYKDISANKLFGKPTRAGYIFEGVNEKKDGTGTWYSDAEGNWSKNAKGDLTIKVAHDKDKKTLEAYYIWKPITYTLVFEMDQTNPVQLQGTFQTITQNNVVVGKSLKEINSFNFVNGLPNLVPLDQNLYFKGWKTPDGEIYSAGTDFVFAAKHIPVDGSTTINLVAVFDNCIGTLTYYYDRSHAQTKVVKVNAGTVITDVNTYFPAKEDFSFVGRDDIIGWTTDKQGTSTYTGTMTPNGNVNLYAVYNSVIVYLNFGNGLAPIKVKMYKDNSKVINYETGNNVDVYAYNNVDIYAWYTSASEQTPDNRVTSSSMAFDFSKIKDGDVLFAKYLN